MFNRKPNNNAAKLLLIESLERDLEHKTRMLEEMRQEALEAADVPALECDMDTLCEELRCAQDAAKDHKKLYDESNGWDVPGRFRAKCLNSMFCKLKEIQCITLQCANANVTAMQLQMFQCTLEGEEERRSLLIDEVLAELEANPVEDWKCAKFIKSVLEPV